MSSFRLLGQVYDEESGLSWTRFRCFDAETGRWLSADPLGLAGGAEANGFDGNPAAVVDSLGLANDDGIARGRGYPYGFGSVGHFRQFSQATRATLKQAGYPDTVALMQGSAVTGRSHDTGNSFDDGRTSDFDVALTGPSLFAEAKKRGLTKGCRTGPLTDEDIGLLGLQGAQDKMSRLAKRPVNFMIFETERAAVSKAPGMLFLK